MARGRAVAIILSDQERVEHEAAGSASQVLARGGATGADRAFGDRRAEQHGNRGEVGRLATNRRHVAHVASPRNASAASTTSRVPARRARSATTRSPEVVTRALETVPEGATHWSRRALAQATGISRDDGAPYLGRHRPATAPRRALQAVERSALDRQGARHHRPLSRPAGPRARALHRRKEPDPGAGPHPADAAHAAGPGGAAQPRL